MPLKRGPSPRYQIKLFTKELRKLRFPTSPISVKLATFVADAFDRFLSGEANSLDEAFGVEKRPGAPKRLSTAKQHRAFSKKILDMRMAGKTTYAIEEETGVDQGAIRRTCKPFRARLMARTISAPSLGLKPRSKREVKPANGQKLSEQEKWTDWKKQHDKDLATVLRSQDISRSLSKTIRPRTKR
jgi:hypothetical protein